ncbi:MAG: M23 family metallopeptidase [bacterium]|nr:M23 family metallopeptidase [bacterium]
MKPIVSDRSLLFILLLAFIFNAWFFRQPGLWVGQAAGFGGPTSNDSDASALISGSFISSSATANNNLDNPEDGFISAEGLILGSSGPRVSSSAARLSGSYFILPSSGLNWGKLHYNNAVDIADLCGRPIKAAAEGLVVEEFSNNRWNNGYGNYVLIEHPNGTKTRYAHAAKNIVKVGDYVDQGQKISLIGNTGNAKGATGCHVHFEVIGAKNPFVIE